MAEKNLSFIGHLAELRLRLVISAAAVASGSIAGWYFIDVIIETLLRPAGGRSFVFLAPADMFLARLKIAFIAGTALAFPVLALQASLFLLPALRGRERKMFLLAVPAAGTLFFGGIAFAQAAILPAALRFFLSFETAGVEPMLSFTAYVDFCLSLLFAFGITFQLPVFMVVLVRTGLIRPRTLSRARKYALLVILTASALLTPPDVISQILLAAPLYLLFEAGILVSRLFGGPAGKHD